MHPRTSMRLVLGTLCFSATAFAGAPAKMTVMSSAFAPNAAIPDEYTCTGSDVSPQLTWTNVPVTAKSIAVLVEDPDATHGTKVHWLVTGIDPVTNALARDAGVQRYEGPCPPAGAVHRYHFDVYALDITLPAARDRTQFMTAISGHVVGHGELIGTYQKK